MAQPVLMKGSHAIGEGAILAGCDAFFGYPITPQTELLEYMAARMPSLGRVFLQAESEISAINMVLGAAAAGRRAMTATSSPGFSLMQEGISYLAGAELPAVLVNLMRAGPGLGTVLGAQADYTQATRGGGHGDYRLLVLAPASAQEALDLTVLSFELADRYRNPVLILADGLVGQAMEPVELPGTLPPPISKAWAATGASGRRKNIIKSIRLDPEEMERHNLRLQEKYRAMASAEVRYQSYLLEDAELVVVAYGTVARVARTAVQKAREAGIRAGLFRPITLWPFPHQQLKAAASVCTGLLVAELSAGQMMEDVRLAVGSEGRVGLVSRLGGMALSPTEVFTALKEASLWPQPLHRGRRRPLGRAA